jgi:2'-deoxynucleoside 5'-phosphate N-hydrolase
MLFKRIFDKTTEIMKAYISISYKERTALQQELETISSVLKSHGITAFIFVDQFQFSIAQEKEMMQQAMLSIDECDLLIAETSDKAIGIGVEAGYAKAKGKKVIYLRNKNAEHSTTLSGISDFQITYTGTDELRQKLSIVLS